jgi:ABC-type bacteriocin/lantibiotic exporter with double-glycine peptidase domain
MGLALLALVARIAIVLAALEASRGSAAHATGWAIGASAAWMVQRLVASYTRVAAECELYAATARALLRGDVLAVASQDLQRAVFQATHHAPSYLAQTLPGLAAEIAAFVVILPIVLGALPPRVVVLAVCALAIVVVALGLVRLATRGLHERVIEASDRVYADVLRALEGRLELVARGGEDEHLGRLDSDLEAYARVARRSNLRAAALGRVPVALAAAAVVAAALGDAAMRSSLETTVVTEALVLGAFAPVVLGIVLGIGEAARVVAQIRPLNVLLSAPERDELRRHGGPVPALPSAVDGSSLAFSYAEQGPTILDDVSFSWRPDVPLVVIGPNGAGKSTLLRLLIGLRPPSSGDIKIGSLDLASSDVATMRRRVAYLPQRPYLGEPYTTVRQAFSSAHASTSEEDMARALDRVGLTGCSLDSMIGELSAGQRQRLALARVLVQGATLIVLDEPDANLDREGIAFVRTLIEELVCDRKMVALAAHTKELAELDGVRVTLDRRQHTSGASGRHPGAA